MDEITFAADFSAHNEVWTMQAHLRWAYGRDDNEPVLQQASRSSLGRIRWDDIPSVRLPSQDEAPAPSSIERAVAEVSAKTPEERAAIGGSKTP